MNFLLKNRVEKDVRVNFLHSVAVKDVMVSYEQIVTETGEMENFLQVAASLCLPVWEAERKVGQVEAVD